MGRPDIGRRLREGQAWGFDGLELACWGDHFEVDKALESDAYVRSRWDILNKYGLKCFAISTHLVGQCVVRSHRRAPQEHPPPRIWGDGDPEGVRQRCAEEVKNTATGRQEVRREGRQRLHRQQRVGQTATCSRPPARPTSTPATRIFADRWTPILDVFQAEGVKFALEVHPTEIAYDIYTTQRRWRR